MPIAVNRFDVRRLVAPHDSVEYLQRDQFRPGNTGEEDAVLAAVSPLQAERSYVHRVFVQVFPRERYERAAKFWPLCRNDRVGLQEDRTPTDVPLSCRTGIHHVGQLHVPLHRHTGDVLGEVQQVHHEPSRKRQTDVSSANERNAPVDVSRHSYHAG
jgi:hypothetical protein